MQITKAERIEFAKLDDIQVRDALYELAGDRELTLRAFPPVDSILRKESTRDDIAIVAEMLDDILANVAENEEWEPEFYWPKMEELYNSADYSGLYLKVLDVWAELRY